MPNSTRAARTARAVAAATSCLLAVGLAAAAPATAAAHHRGTTYLHTTSRHHVLAPSTMRPGLVRLHNSGKDPVAIFGKRSAAGPYQLAHELSSGAKTPKRLFKDFVVRDQMEPHQTIYLPLRRGTLYLVDARKLHVTAAGIRTVRVAGRTSNASVPKSRPVTIAADNSLHAASTVPYRGTLHVMNHSDGLQQVILARISSSTSKTSLDAFAAHPTVEGLFRLHLTSFTAVATLSGHHGLWTTLSGARGHYGLFVFSFAGHHLPVVRMLTVG